MYQLLKLLSRSNVLEHITTERALHKDVGICFAYYNYQSADFGDVSLIISALIKQLCRKKDVVPPGFLKLKQDAMDPSQLGNQDSFTTIATEFGEVFLVIDALDECPKNDRHKILGFLSELANTRGHTKMKIFVTSRREGDIAEEFEKLKTLIFQIEAKNVAADILRYVGSETQRLRDGYNGKKLYVNSDALKEKIVRTLTEKADGM
jgi:ankyrin repeat domain-containing protein 50